jgi:hypothetical protein
VLADWMVANGIMEEVPVSVSENDSNISRAELLKNYMPKI